MWLTAADTVSVPITHPELLAVAVLLQVQNCSLLLGPVFEIKVLSDIKIGQWGRPWLVWYVPCKRRCCETHSVGTQRQSVGEPHDAIFTVSDEISLESPIQWQFNVLLQSLASIPQIYQSIFQINLPKTVYSEPCHVDRGEKCPDASRMFALKYRVRRDLNTDVSVFDWHARLATRWCLAVAKGLRENCRDVGRAPARKIFTVICHRSGQHYLKSGGPSYI